MNIAIMMSVWCQNLWDELILKNEIQLLREKYGKKTKFKVFTYDVEDIFYQDGEVEYLEYFPIWMRKPKNIFRNLKNYYSFIKTVKWADSVVIGWGGIFFDNEAGNFSNPLKQWLFRVEILKMLKKNIIIFWVSIDIKLSKNFASIQKIFSQATEVYVRDKASFELLQNMWISSEIILDPVFDDNGQEGRKNYEKNYLFKKIDAWKFCLEDIKEFQFSGKTVWLALRKWYLWVSNWNIENELIHKIIEYILTSGWKVVLLPHSFHTIDTEANDYEFLKNFLEKWVSITENMKETYEIYKQKKIDFCLSMRLHSMILSQVYGIEFVGISYSQKTQMV